MTSLNYVHSLNASSPMEVILDGIQRKPMKSISQMHGHQFLKALVDTTVTILTCLVIWIWMSGVCKRRHKMWSTWRSWRSCCLICWCCRTWYHCEVRLFCEIMAMSCLLLLARRTTPERSNVGRQQNTAGGPRSHLIFYANITEMPE
jgi:hypothetical protein